MRAAQLVGPKQFSFTDVPTPTVGQGNVLIEIERWSICGSDIRNLYGAVLPEHSYPAPIGNPWHEIAGRIVESRSDRWNVGQRVIALPHGRDDALVEHYEVLPNRMIAIPDEGDPGDWLMCQPSGTVLYSCAQMGSVLGKNVLVLGQGSIGLSFTMITSRMGARNVISADLLDYRLEKAKLFGATHTVNPDKQDLTEAVMEITNGEGADITVEAAGYPDTFNLAFSQVKQFGTVMIFGIQSDKYVPLEHNYLMDKQPRIIPTTGARSGDPITQIRDMINLRNRGWADPAELVTHRLGFSGVQQAYDMYEQRQDEIIKVVMDISK